MTLIAVAACLLFSSQMAHGQAAAPAATAAADGAATPQAAAAAAQNDDNTSQNRVVVTAQKRPQFAEKVPMSLSALTNDQLVKQGATDIQDLSRLAPGLSANASTIFGTPNIAIRGVSSLAGAATTAIYIDDAPIHARGLSAVAGGTAYPQLFDLDRVEVLRGPQGTLVGSSAEGGAIRFITPTPRTDRMRGEFKAGLSATQDGDMSYQAGMGLGGPLAGESAGFRASLWHKRDGGYIDHVNRQTGALTDSNSNRSEATVGRAALLLRPSTALTISPSIYVQETKDRDRNIYYEDAGRYKTYNHLRQPTHDKFSLSALAISYETDAVILKSVTSFYDRKQQRIDDYSYAITPSFTGGNEILPGRPDYVVLNRQNTNQRNITQELRVSSNDEADARISWVGGLYFSRARQTQSQRIEQDIDAFTFALFGAPAVAIFGSPGVGPGGLYSYTEDDVLKDRQEAIFGEANIKLRPDTTLTLGLRAGRNEFTFATDEDGPLAGGPVGFSGKQSGRSVLPKFALSQELARGDLVYASAARGDRVGGANPSYATVPGCTPDLRALGLVDVPRTYDADSLWSYELGYKGRMLDQRLEVAASAYYIDWTDIQSQVTLPTCLFGYTANLGKARSVGADVQLQMRVSPSLTLSGSVAYTDAKYTRTSYASGAETGAGSPLVVKGQTLPVPSVNVTLGAEYSWAPSVGMRAYVRGDYQYAGSYRRTGPVGSYNYDPGLYEAPATHHVSLHSGLRQGPLELTLFVNNLLNSTTALMRTHNGPGNPAYQASTFRPRTLGITAAYKF